MLARGRLPGITRPDTIVHGVWGPKSGENPCLGPHFSKNATKGGPSGVDTAGSINPSHRPRHTQHPMRPETKFEPERAPGRGLKVVSFGEGSYSFRMKTESALDGASQERLVRTMHHRVVETG